MFVHWTFLCGVDGCGPFHTGSCQSKSCSDPQTPHEWWHLKQFISPRYNAREVMIASKLWHMYETDFKKIRAMQASKKCWREETELVCTFALPARWSMNEVPLEIYDFNDLGSCDFAYSIHMIPSTWMQTRLGLRECRNTYNKCSCWSRNNGLQSAKVTWGSENLPGVSFESLQEESAKIVYCLANGLWVRPLSLHELPGWSIEN